MRTKAIKVCGLCEQQNIAEVIRLKPDYIGFIFYEGSKRNACNKIDPDFIWSIDSSIKKTGVFVNDDAMRIINYIALYNLDYVQLHGNESPAFCEEIRKYAGVIKTFGIDEHIDFATTEAYQPVTDFFLFDTKTAGHGGSGIQFDHSLLKKYKTAHPYFLSGGINGTNAERISAYADERLHALDVNSGFEDRPGIKNIKKLKSILT